MAPEVALAQNYDETCDIYSWAIVVWQMVSKKTPYLGMVIPRPNPCLQTSCNLRITAPPQLHSIVPNDHTPLMTQGGIAGHKERVVIGGEARPS